MGEASDDMRIGQLARRAGVSVDTVRFYERRGVLPAPRRRQSGYRVYSEATLERLRLARALQTLGFTLEEIIDALAALDAGAVGCASERHRLDAVLSRLDAKIAELEAVRSRAARVLRECDAGRCGLLERDP